MLLIKKLATRALLITVFCTPAAFAQTTQTPVPLVRGLYALTDAAGRTSGYVNKAGTLRGDARSGFKLRGPDGLRELTPTEQAELRQELMDRIAWDKLVKVSYGNGGGRRVLMFSALDCPYCRGFEDALSLMEGQFDSTFYVVPSSLYPTARGGLPTWEKVSRIWCAAEPGNAWQGFWSEGSIPPAARPSCDFADPRAAERAREQLVDVLRAVGIRIIAVPQFVREDGVALRAGARMEMKDLDGMFGAKGKPAGVLRGSAWLAD